MKDKVYGYMNWPRIEAIVYEEEDRPREVMAPRVLEDKILVQGYFPGAAAVKAVDIDTQKSYELIKEDEAGYFAGFMEGDRIPRYQYEILGEDGKIEKRYDPYAFEGRITPDDEKRFCAGIHYGIYKVLGAHPATVNGVEGTFFGVWAPNAISVSVVGDFNQWDGRSYPMHRLGMSGIYELFIPQAAPGDIYKYRIRKKGGESFLKADPYAQQAEQAPADGSVIPWPDTHPWKDESWMEQRKQYAGRQVPLHIWETDLREWAKEGDTYESLADTLAEKAVEWGYTHIELHPVTECLTKETNGYAPDTYYAPAAWLGRGEAFREFVDRLHQKKIGVILDWSAAQFSQNPSGLKQFDGTCLYEKKNEKESVHPVWGTLLYDYGSPMVKNFLIGNALYWAECFHIDGLRMDDVDAMLYLDYARGEGNFTPNMYGTNENLEALEFLKHMNSIVKKRYPEFLLIAQEDGLWPALTESVEKDCLGFDYKWSGGWSSDFLEYMRKDTGDKGNYYDSLTLSMLYAYMEEYILTLGSRDIGSMREFLNSLPGEEQQKRACLKAAYLYFLAHPGKKMSVISEDISPELKSFIKEANRLYTGYPAFYQLDDDPEGFEWIQDMGETENVLAFIRKTEKPEETLLAVFNFSGQSYEKYPVGVPYPGKYKELIHTDIREFGGSSSRRIRARSSQEVEWDERKQSLQISLPAQSAVIFSCTLQETKRPAAKKPARTRTAKTAKKTAKTVKEEKTAKTAKTTKTVRKTTKERKN